MHLSCTSSPSASRKFVLAYAGASERGAETSMIGLAVADAWDGPYRRVDAPLASREAQESEADADSTLHVEVSPQGRSGPDGVGLDSARTESAEMEAILPSRGRVAQDGVVLTPDANMSSLSDPFLYVYETVDAPPSFHLLFAASGTKEEAENSDEGAQSGSGGAETANATTGSSKDSTERADSRCDQAVYHAHAPSLAGPWTVSKASSSNYIQHDDSGVDQKRIDRVRRGWSRGLHDLLGRRKHIGHCRQARHR